MSMSIFYLFPPGEFTDAETKPQDFQQSNVLLVRSVMMIT